MTLTFGCWVFKHPLSAGDYRYSIREDQLGFVVPGARIRIFPPRDFINAYFHAGFLIELQRAEVAGKGGAVPKSGTGFNQNNETATEAGVLAGGGAELALGPGAAFAELNFKYTGVNHQLSGSTGLGRFSLDFGYRLMLGR